MADVFRPRVGAFNTTQCAASVSSPPSWYDHQCARKGTIEEDGHKWCRQHAPSAEKAKAEARQEKYRAQYARFSIRSDIERASKEVIRLAIEAAHQRASIDAVFEAASAYERLCAERDALKVEHEKKGLLK